MTAFHAAVMLRAATPRHSNPMGRNWLHGPWCDVAYNTNPGIHQTTSIFIFESMLLAVHCIYRSTAGRVGSVENFNAFVLYEVFIYYAIYFHLLSLYPYSC